MINQSTTDTSIITYAEYLEVLEAQRLVLLDLLSNCDNGACNHEPHAYHSDDTYDDLNSALEIYAALLDFLIDGEQALPNIEAWFNEQADDAIRNDADSENDFDEPMALFACDSITSEFQTLFTRCYKARLTARDETLGEALGL